jgi:hypothetical protein
VLHCIQLMSHELGGVDCKNSQNWIRTFLQPLVLSLDCTMMRLAKKSNGNVYFTPVRFYCNVVPLHNRVPLNSVFKVSSTATSPNYLQPVCYSSTFIYSMHCGYVIPLYYYS